jgi:predicted MFS family arabinose efflux permease
MQNVKSWGNMRNVISDSMYAREPSVGKSFGWTRRKESLVAVYLTAWIYVVALCLTIPVLPFYVRELGASSSEVGVMLSVNALLRGSSAFFMAKVSDRFGRRPLYLVTFAGVTVGYMLSMMAYNFTQLVVAQAIFCTFEAGNSIAISFISDLVRENERAKAFNTFGLVVGTALIGGMPLGSLLTKISMTTPFMVAGFLTSCAFAISVALHPPPSELVAMRSSIFKKVGKNRQSTHASPGSNALDPRRRARTF